MDHDSARMTLEAAPGEAPAPAAAEPERVTRPSGRLGQRWLNAIKATAGAPAQRRLAYAALQLPRIRYWEKEFDKLSDADLRLRALQLRGRARGGESLTRLLPEAYGAVCVAAKRT